MRFILDTIGKKTWLGGKVAEEWSELVCKNNDKAAGEDNDGSYKWMDELIPPGRTIRCIVSVAMLAEGWERASNNVLILRPLPQERALYCLNQAY